MRLQGDALFAAGVFTVFSFGTYRALVMNDPSGGPSDVGAAFFPFWVCVFIQILTAVIFVKSLRTGTKVAADGIGKKRLILLSSILALLFGYIFIMDTLGFIASSILFLVLVHQLLVFFETGRISRPKGLVFSVSFFSAISVLLFFLFNTVFRLALP